MSEIDQEKSKAFFASRTAWWNLSGIVIAALAAWRFPKLKDAVCGNQELAVTIGLITFSAFCAVNLWLRKITHCRIGKAVPVLLLVLAGCASSNQVLDEKLFYKRDVGIEVNGKQYEGVVTVPYAKSYNFVLAPKGDIDLMLIRTCHRTYSVEKVSSGWFGKNKFAYSYSPIEGIEDTRTCPIRLDVYESSKAGRHSWAFIDFENPMYQVQAELTCDGSIRRINGVGVCQAKKQTVQRIRFDEPIRFAPPKPEGCARPAMVSGAYEILTSLGECLYHYDTWDGRLGRLTIVGFEGVLIREPQ